LSASISNIWHSLGIVPSPVWAGVLPKGVMITWSVEPHLGIELPVAVSNIAGNAEEGRLLFYFDIYFSSFEPLSLNHVLYDILTEAKEPMHLTEIIRRAKSDITSFSLMPIQPPETPGGDTLKSPHFSVLRRPVLYCRRQFFLLASERR
jgi:hypothetical protein